MSIALKAKGWVDSGVRPINKAPQDKSALPRFDNPILKQRSGVSGLYAQELDGCFLPGIGDRSDSMQWSGKGTAGDVNDGSSASLRDRTPLCASFERRLAALAPALKQLQAAYRNDTLPLLRISEATDDIEAVEAAYEKLARGARNIIFFGTGGSGLGGQTLAQIAGWGIPGAKNAGQAQRPRTRFYDNLDGDTLAGALGALDLASSRFVITSKSGGTAETLTQFICTLQAVKAAGLEAKIPNLFLGLTEPRVAGVKNGLRDLCEHYGIPVLDHHPGIGGRYSVLTNVGLLPAVARGLDVRALRAGARAVIDDMMCCDDPAGFAPAQGAAASVTLARDAGIHVQVMMPYADRLSQFAQWFVQLWAESLGKDGQGTTPVAALGPLGQHSQLQLFMDGPCEHLITIMTVAGANPGPVIDQDLAAIAGVDHLGSHRVGDLVAVQARGVIEALGRAGRPVRSFVLPSLDERVVGGLMMHFMLETILAGSALGVDPFDQPAVELAKQLAQAQL